MKVTIYGWSIRQCLLLALGLAQLPPISGGAGRSSRRCGFYAEILGSLRSSIGTFQRMPALLHYDAAERSAGLRHATRARAISSLDVYRPEFYAGRMVGAATSRRAGLGSAATALLLALTAGTGCGSFNKLLILLTAVRSS